VQPLLTTASLTSAQILTLGTTPVTIVAAQGAGTVIIPVQAFGSLTFLTSQYANAGVLNLSWNGANGIAAANLSSNLIAAASQVASQGGLSVATIATASLANLPLTVHSTGAVTAGAGSWKLTVLYLVAAV
jgi:hypothetical protein